MNDILFRRETVFFLAPGISLNPHHCGGGQRIGIELHREVRRVHRAELFGNFAQGGANPGSGWHHYDARTCLAVINRASSEVGPTCLTFVNWLPPLYTLERARFRGHEVVVLFCHDRNPRDWGVDDLNPEAGVLFAFHSLWLRRCFERLHPRLRTATARVALAAGCESRAERPASESGPTVSFAGALLAEKGVLDLVETFRRDGALRERTKLRIAGDPQLWGTSVGTPVDPARLEEVAEYVGPMPYQEMAAFWRATDVMVMPSHYKECLPITTIEALAAGCAVVASDVAGNREVLRGGQWGKLYAAGDVAALGKAVHRALDRPAEPQARAAMHEYVTSEFAWNTVVAP